MRRDILIRWRCGWSERSRPRLASAAKSIPSSIMRPQLCPARCASRGTRSGWRMRSIASSRSRRDQASSDAASRAAQISLLHHLIVAEALGAAGEHHFAGLQYIAVGGDRERHVGVLLHHENGGALTVDRLDEIE